MTVDFDYFFDYRPPEDKPWRFDWGFGENAFFREWMWYQRMAADPEVVEVLRPEGDRNFWARLSALGFQLPMVARVGDSHLFAAAWFGCMGREGVQHVVNVDYHADCDLQNGDTRIMCDNWLLHLLLLKRQEGRPLKPIWVAKYRGASRPSALDRWQVAVATLEEFETLGLDKPIEVEALYVAQSSAWTPPWADDRFFEFVEASGCTLSVEKEDPPKRRGWDEARARRMQEEMEKCRNILATMAS